MTLDDAIFNWLQIRYVASKRPDDEAAQETYDFFTTMLEEDHHVQNMEIKNQDGMYTIQFEHEGKHRKKQFPAEFVHQLFHDIESEPKYN